MRLVAGAALVAALASTALAAPAADVTLRVERFYDPVCSGSTSGQPGGCHKLRFSGTISNGAANEYVALLSQKCGVSGVGASFVGVQTREGGSWEATEGRGGGTYWARWGDHLSEPVRVRVPVSVFLTKLRGGSRQLGIRANDSMQNFSRRTVELQGLAGGRWIRVRQARLVADPKSYRTFTAKMAVRQRGLRLRVLIPAKSAAPCYLETATKTWVS